MADGRHLRIAMSIVLCGWITVKSLDPTHAPLDQKRSRINDPQGE